MISIVLDSSTIISVSDSCLIRMLERLSNKTGIEFVITEGVEKESVITPSRIRRFELSALRVREAISAGWLRVMKRDASAIAMTNEMLNAANSVFIANGRQLQIIQEGEAETVAIAKRISAGAMAIDERTTRMLFEDPYGLKAYLEYKYEEKISIDQKQLNYLTSAFGGTRIFRSTEFIALAHELNLFGPDLGNEKRDLEAALYALKFKGCAVSENEISDFVSGK